MYLKYFLKLSTTASECPILRVKHFFIRLRLACSLAEFTQRFMTEVATRRLRKENESTPNFSVLDFLVSLTTDEILDNFSLPSPSPFKSHFYCCVDMNR